MRIITQSVLVFLFCIACKKATTENQELFEVIAVSTPVIDSIHPHAKGNKYGFEGGRIVEIGDTLHWVTAEMSGDPKLVKMSIAHWKCRRGTDEWKRVSTLYESSGEFAGKDTRAALWGPMPIFDAENNEWNLFYVSYRAKENTDSAWYLNHDGKIWRSVSSFKGINGIGGPYVNDTVIMSWGKASDSWEGLQGTDSFFPYKVKNKWLAFYGSAQTQYVPCKFWGVGLAAASSLKGPWKRKSTLNPVNFKSKFAENPVVCTYKKNKLIALLDGGHINQNFGYSVSINDTTWQPASFIKTDNHPNRWWTLMRTPLCILDDADGTYTVYFTAFTKNDFACLGKVKLRMK